MKAYTEFLFWFHIVLILAAIAAGYFLQPFYVSLLIVLHEMHVKLFHGCILTKYEKSLHGLPPTADFFQYAVKRIVGVRVSKAVARRINYSLLLFSLLLSIYKFGFVLM